LLGVYITLSIFVLYSELQPFYLALLRGSRMHSQTITWR